MSEYNNQRGNADQNHSAIFSHLLDLLQSKRQEIIVGRDIEKKKSLLVGMSIALASMDMATHSSFCLKNSMDREAWQATVSGVAKNQT